MPTYQRPSLPTSTPAVSVVIPCFNAEKTIVETLESVFQQTLSDIEIIAVDDGSTDGTCRVLDRYSDRILIVAGPNGGASKARNRGTALARGRYIQYLDADDLLTPTALEGRVASLEASVADVAYCDYQYFETDPAGVRQDGRRVTRTIADVHADPEIAVATTFWAPPVALLYRRPPADRAIHWVESLPMIEDARFLFETVRSGGTLVHVPGVSAFYRVTPGSLSRCNKPAYVQSVYRNGCAIQRLWQSDGPLSDERKEAIAWIMRGAAYELLMLDLPEFENAVSRYQSVSGQRFDFLGVARLLSRAVGRRRSVSMLQRAVNARSWLSSGAPAPLAGA